MINLQALSPLQMLAALTGERIMAVDESRLNANSEREAAQPKAGIAIVPLLGAMTPRAITYYGRTVFPGTDTFRAGLAQGVADPNVGAIVLDVNSPGGTYASTPETAAAVAAAAAVKPVIAVVDTLAASAAYFAIAHATEIVVTPSGEVGSIGVLATHIEMSKMMEKEGYTATIIRSRPGKADVNPFEPLTGEARAALEKSVMEADADFLNTVAKGRKVTVSVVKEQFGQGRLVGAKESVRVGMADRVATMSDVLSGLVRSRAPARRRSALAFV